ncbi:MULTISPECIES: hypothetical protein [unclassified Microbacterium]|uniref:hypothetical protein n=1 Tax=unclassified Microbacterium TaxID=2609290 RepID=UPI00341BD3CE
MSPDDAAELRALQGKAYGRDGRLTDQEARRLADLESARSMPSGRPDLGETVEPDATDGRVAQDEPSTETPVPRVVDTPREPTGGRPSSEPSGGRPSSEPSADPAASWRRVVQTHLRVVISASLALLLVGVAAGWALFGRGSDAAALSPGQQERRVELQAGDDYDDGSVRLIAEDDDTVVWYATRRDGELACVVLDVGEASQDQCARADAEGGEPLNVSLSVPVSDPDDPAEEYGTSISATVGFTTSGEPLAWIYRWEINDTMLGQFDGAERERAEALVADGYLPGLSIVGYFHDEPVWLAERPADGTQSGGFVQCMVVDAASEATACQVSDDRNGGLRAFSLETADDGTTVLWTLRIRFTGWGSPYLTIEQGDPADIGISYIELGGEHQDPILVEVPTSESGG